LGLICEDAGASSVNAGRVHAACRNGGFYSSDDAGESPRQLSPGLKIDDLPSLALTHA
jgi:hypothetical protein